MSNLLTQLEEIKNSLNLLSEKINNTKSSFVNKDNLFNKKFSVILGAFEDISVFTERLYANIEESVRINQIIQQRNKFKDKKSISGEGQKLRKDAGKLARFIKTDFRALYIFSKIFLDEFTDLISFILSLDTKSICFKNKYGNPSVTTLFYSLESYNGNDKVVNDFKTSCLNRFKAVNIFVTRYRDEYVVHKNIDNPVTTWFINEMNGGVRFLTKTPSITPEQLVFVVRNFVTECIKFILDNYDEL